MLPDMTASSDYNSFIGLLDTTHFGHDVLDVLTRCDKEDFIICFDDSIALWNDSPVIAKDCGDPCIYRGDVLTKITQFLVDKRSAVISFDAYQLCLAFCEIHDLQCAGIIDEPSDVVSYNRLGVDNNVDWHGIVAENSIISYIGGGTNSGNFCWRVEDGVGNLASYHVDLITVRHSDKHVGIFGAGLTQDIWMRSHAPNGSNIEPVLKLSQSIAISVDDSDVARFLGQVLGKIATNFTGSENDDLHIATLRIPA